MAELILTPNVQNGAGPEDEDLGNEVAVTLQLQRGEELLQRIRGGGSSVSTLDAPPVQDSEQQQQQPAQPAAIETAADPVEPPGSIDPEDVPEPATGEDGEGDGSLGDLLPSAGEVARGLAGGIVETPEAIANGLAETIADNVSLLNDFDVAIQKKLQGTAFDQKSVFADITRAAIPGILAGFQENEEKTLIGNMVRDITNFTGMMVGVAGKVNRTKAIVALAKKAPRLATVTANTISGAIAAFATVDTLNTELRDLLDDHPSLRGGVLEFMAGNEDDTALDIRTREALAGAGAGVVGDSLFLGLKWFRGALRSQIKLRRLERAAVKRAGGFRKPLTKEELAEQVPRFTQAEVSINELDADGVLVRTAPARAARRLEKSAEEVGDKLTPEGLKSKAREALAEADTDRVEINFDRIIEADDVDGAVNQLMQDTTDLFAGSVGKARRGVVTDVAAQEAADSLDIGIKEVLTRRVGTVLNKEQTTAFRRVWVSAAEVTERLARVARLSGSDVDNFKFRKAMSVFNAINQSVLGARAEAGRSVQAWRISVAGDAERAAVIGALVENSGRSRASGKLAENFLNAIDAGYSPGQINAMAERGVFARTMDAVKESSVVSLLWRPSTHAANAISNSVRIALGIIEKGVAARIGNETMTVDGVVAGEAMAQYRGTMAAIKAIYNRGAEADILREATRTSVASIGKKTDVRINSISAAKFGLAETSGLGKTVETVGNLIGAPARFLEKSDDLYKMVAYGGETSAQAFRQGTREGAEKGWDIKRMALRIAELESSPPEHIRLAAGNAALYSTFTQQAGSGAAALFKIRDTIPGGFLILPFIKTPMNILRYDFEFSPLAPLVRQWRQDIARGGASRDIALARMALGTTATALFADWAWEGTLQGPLSTKSGVREAMLRQGFQSDSLLIGSQTFRINRLDPWGLNASVTAGIVNMLQTHQLEEEDFPDVSELFAGVAVSMSQSILQKTSLTGLSRLAFVMQEPERRGPRFVQQTMQMLFPLSSLSTGIQQAITPEASDVTNLNQTFQKMIGLESRLPRAYDLWGEIRERPRLDIFTPVQVRAVEISPIDREIAQNGFDVKRIFRKTDFAGAEVDFRDFPRVYEAYVVMAGKGSKIDGLSAKPMLNRVVASDEYRTASKEFKGIRIRRWITGFRKRAQADIMFDPEGRFQSEEFSEFRELVNQRIKERQALAVPSVENIQ